MATNGVTRRLTALEQIAEDCRRRQRDDEIRTHIVRRAGELGIALTPAKLEADMVRASAVADLAECWASEGLTIEDIGRRLAVERGIDPDALMAIYRRIKAERSAP